MGTVSTPGVPKPGGPAGPAAPPGPPGPPSTNGGGDAPPGPVQTTGRFKFEGRKMPLGPSLGTIFGVLAAFGVGIWFYLKPPSTVENISLPKYTSFEAPLELGSPRDCRSEKGCLLIYIGTDAKSVDSIPDAVELSEALRTSGVETIFAVGRDQMKECVRVARAFRRPVLLDPEGKVPRSLDTHETRFWVVYDGLGNLKERTGEAMSSVGVLRRLGL